MTDDDMTKWQRESLLHIFEEDRKANDSDRLVNAILIVLCVVIAVWAIADWALPDVRAWMEGRKVVVTL